MRYEDNVEKREESRKISNIAKIYPSKVRTTTKEQRCKRRWYFVIFPALRRFDGKTIQVFSKCTIEIILRKQVYLLDNFKIDNQKRIINTEIKKRAKQTNKQYPMFLKIIKFTYCFIRQLIFSNQKYYQRHCYDHL